MHFNRERSFHPNPRPRREPEKSIPISQDGADDITLTFFVEVASISHVLALLFRRGMFYHGSGVPSLSRPNTKQLCNLLPFVHFCAVRHFGTMLLIDLSSLAWHFSFCLMIDFFFSQSEAQAFFIFGFFFLVWKSYRPVKVQVVAPMPVYMMRFFLT